MAEQDRALAELAFTLEYDGPALASHEMDVKQLAPALLATAELFQEMNRLQYPDNPPVSVNLRATREGSIDVHLILVVVGQTVKLLSGPEATALLNLKNLLGGFGKLIDYIKFRGDKTPESLHSSTPGTIRLSLDGVEMEFPETVEAFAANPRIRSTFKEIVQPLGGGVEVVRFRQQEVVIGEIEESEAPKFQLPPAASPEEAEEVNRDVHEMALRVVSPWFRKGNKWIVTDGDREFWVSVLDEKFVGDILAARTVLTPQDILRCRVRVIQSLDAVGTLHATYEIEAVLEHVVRPQRDLFED